MWLENSKFHSVEALYSYSFVKYIMNFHCCYLLFSIICRNPSLMKSISSSAGYGTLMNSGLQVSQCILNARVLTGWGRGHSFIYAHFSFQTALAEASLPGLKKDNVRGNSKSQIQRSSMADSHRNQNFSPRVQP